MSHCFYDKISFSPFPNKNCFLHVCSTSLLKTLKKGEIAHNEQYLIFPQCFLPFQRTFCHIHQIQNCRLATLSSLESVIRERLKTSWSMEKIQS